MEIRDFEAIRISLASPEEILSWSHGEVTKPETINYRRLRPEKDGLFCEAIFGPTKDWQCYCGKYKKIRYKGIVCDKCGVEVTRSSVRRERMGHIELATPVAHIWYTRRVPSYLGLLLDISRRDLDRIQYYAQYIITRLDEDARNRALRRMRDEAAREVARLQASVYERVQALETELAAQLEALDTELSEENGELEDELTGQTDTITSAARRIQDRINDETGLIAQAAIIFETTGEQVVAPGESISAAHLTRLAEAAQAAIERLEAETRRQQEENRTLAKAKRDQLHHETMKRIEALEKELASETETIQEAIQPDYEELTGVKVGELVTEAHFRELKAKWGGIVQGGMGAEALRQILEHTDLDKMITELRTEIRSTRSQQRRRKATKRLQVAEALKHSGSRPEWMVLTVLPVIPPDLRPMVQLDGGRFATSDLNDLYRRVINRNNRLKKLVELGAPDVIIRNEKRMLQEAVDSLIDNSRRGKAISLRGRRKLKSLSDMLKGKQGRFRRNLLGKRVDYSGRSVIVVGPDLKLHQCGLPKKMALELFRPFVVHKLVEYNYAHNIKGAKRLIEGAGPEVWEALEEVIEGCTVLLNRAPTLHRLGIQAFEPVLTEGDAIQIHPLVCTAFNADFDGDMMAVHVPLSQLARKEARELMLSSQNLLLPANGEPVVAPTKDIVLGCYYLTLAKEGARGEGKLFANLDEVVLAYDLGKVDLHAQIKVLYTPGDSAEPERLETTVGRVLFNLVLPEELRFINHVLDKGSLKDLVAGCHYLLGTEATATLADKIKEIGFRFATRSGTTIAIGDIVTPESKPDIIAEAAEQVKMLEGQCERGIITEDEVYAKTVELWSTATERITEAVANSLDPWGPIHMMAMSGATKGGFQPIRQLAGMRGLMADPAGRIIALPIQSSFREGLSPFEYFISTHGARKGLADTALRTAQAGYLTRRLVDVVQDVIVNDVDCGTRTGIWIRQEGDEITGRSFAERILGRLALEPVVDPGTGEILVAAGQMIEEDQVEAIVAAGTSQVHVRSPLGCLLEYGICAHCHGRDLARGGLVKVGEAVGIIAAQSIGEPGTQLTLRTFHTGGVAEGADITHGLPRVEQLFEARNPKGTALISDRDGVVEVVRVGDTRFLRIVENRDYHDEYTIPSGYDVLVSEGQEIEEGTILARGEGGEVIATPGGQVHLDDHHVSIHYQRREAVEHEIPATARLQVEHGQRVSAGQQLIQGTKNPHHILRILGREAVQEYLLEEIQRVYRSQGVGINDKHIEIILRQMLSKVRVTSPGDTNLLHDDFVDRMKFEEINQKTVQMGAQPATAEQVLLGITKVALTTESFLSASSFQHTISVLANAVVQGKVDNLHGLKENVIIGKLIPAGTGFRAKEVLQEAEEEMRTWEERARRFFAETQEPEQEIIVQERKEVASLAGSDSEGK